MKRIYVGGAHLTYETRKKYDSPKSMDKAKKSTVATGILKVDSAQILAISDY